MAGEAYREYCRSQHRAIGHYLAVQAWLRGVDCIVLTRGDLEALLDLERFRGKRRKWMEEDLLPWFPHLKWLFWSKKPGKPLGSLFLSRISFQGLPNGVMSDPMRDEDRVAKLNEHKGGPKAALLRKKGEKPLTLVQVVADLAVSMTGLLSPTKT